MRVWPDWLPASLWMAACARRCHRWKRNAQPLLSPAPPIDIATELIPAGAVHGMRVWRICAIGIVVVGTDGKDATIAGGNAAAAVIPAASHDIATELIPAGAVPCRCAYGPEQAIAVVFAGTNGKDPRWRKRCSRSVCGLLHRCRGRAG